MAAKPYFFIIDKANSLKDELEGQASDSAILSIFDMYTVLMKSNKRI